MKVWIPFALGVLSMVILCATPAAYAADGGEISPSEFDRYQRQQELELEHEQALRAERSAPQSPEEAKRQRRQFEAERFRQRLLLEQQRRRLAAERARLRPMPRRESSRVETLQRLHREQASEQLSRKLLR